MVDQLVVPRVGHIQGGGHAVAERQVAGPDVDGVHPGTDTISPMLTTRRGFRSSRSAPCPGCLPGAVAGQVWGRRGSQHLHIPGTRQLTDLILLYVLRHAIVAIHASQLVVNEPKASPPAAQAKRNSHEPSIFVLV